MASFSWTRLSAISAIVLLCAHAPTFGSGSLQFPPRKEECFGTVALDTFLYIFSRASTGSEPIGKLQNGDKVWIQSRTTGEDVYGNRIWYFIDGGYVPGAYIQLDSPGHPFWCLNYEW